MQSEEPRNTPNTRKERSWEKIHLIAEPNSGYSNAFVIWFFRFQFRVIRVLRG